MIRRIRALRWAGTAMLCVLLASACSAGAVERSVLVSTEHALFWLEASLSSDRYVAILDTVLPDPDKGQHAVQIVDLVAGQLLDVELRLGEVP